jgi:hypothetical protein
MHPEGFLINLLLVCAYLIILELNVLSKSLIKIYLLIYVSKNISEKKYIYIYVVREEYYSFIHI